MGLVDKRWISSVAYIITADYLKIRTVRINTQNVNMNCVSCNNKEK